MLSEIVRFVFRDGFALATFITAVSLVAQKPAPGVKNVVKAAKTVSCK